MPRFPQDDDLRLFAKARDLNTGRIIAVNRFYAPDLSATAQLLADLAEHLAAQGQPVTVITSRLRYDGPKGVLPARESLNGVRICRVWTTRFGRAGLWGRGLDYASFYLSATLALFLEARPGDTILVKTDPPLMSIPAALVRRLRRARLVNWCQDLFPEVAASVGFAWTAGPLGRFLRRLRNRTLRRADANVVLNQPMRAHLLAQAIPDARIRVIHNWCTDGLAPTPRRPAASPLPAGPPVNGPFSNREALNGHQAEPPVLEPFTICYSGNLGRVHNVGAIIELIERTQDLARVEAVRYAEPAMHEPRRAGQGEERAGGDADPSTRTSDEAPGRPGAVSGASATLSGGLQFRFVGGGVGHRSLQAAIAEHGWTHIAFEPYAPRHRLNESLGSCDAHLITLDPACEGLIQPSKIYGILAVGRPAIFVGSRAGGVARLLERHSAGLALDIESPATWVLELQALLADPARLASMGSNARTAFERHYSPALAMAAWADVLLPAAAPVAQPAGAVPAQARTRAAA